MLSIYNVTTYRIKEENWSKICSQTDINGIVKMLDEKKSFHERIENTKMHRLVVDIDGTDKPHTQILNDISSHVGVNVDEISYTTNFAKKGSHHFVIPNYYMKGELQHSFWGEFKNKGYEEVDLSIYATGKWFRLPNQLKEGSTGSEHIIQHGQMSDFILNYIDDAKEFKYEGSSPKPKPKPLLLTSSDIKNSTNYMELLHLIKNGCYDSRCTSGSHQKYIEIGGRFKKACKNWQGLWWELTLRGTQNKRSEFDEQVQSIKEIGDDYTMKLLRDWAESENKIGFDKAQEDFKQEYIKSKKQDVNEVLPPHDVRSETDSETQSEIPETQSETDVEFPVEFPVDEPDTVFSFETFQSITVNDDEIIFDEEELLPYPDSTPPLYIPQGKTEKEISAHKKQHQQILKKYNYEYDKQKKEIDKQNVIINFNNEVKKMKLSEDILYAKRKEYFEQFHAKVLSPLVFIRKGSEKAEMYSNDTFNNLYKNLHGFCKQWTLDINIKTYEHIKFLPPPHYCPPNVFNLYEGLAGDNVVVDESLVEEKTEIFKKQFWLLCGKNDDGLEYVLNYLAHIIQLPGILPRTSIVFKSKQGVGKNLAFEMFAEKLLGERYLLVSSKMEDVLGRFPLINQKLLVILDETNGQSAFANSEQIKSYIGCKTLTYEKKGVDGITILNTGRMIFFTNNDNSVKIESSDRRFSVFECADDHRLDDVYFKKLAKAYEEDWSFLFHFLKTRDISNFEPTNDRVKTDIYKELMLNSADNVTKFIILNHEDWKKDSTHILVNDNTHFKSNWFYSEYKLWCKESEIKPYSELGFSKKFMEICEKKKTMTGNLVCIPLVKLEEFIKKY